ncbi:MAG: HEPN domain-containing protein [Candidatus Methanoperedens sp.]|nr:HEPN domain-containing protein [Candidatus Methanoperedens sp.]MCZ7361518.1 HEPN domain-containing protein [Candidatus Methanoperedens sp.]HLB70460.1 HEPN domain-containing protein [Candidatus Methanoperedens sp.]
MNTRMMAQDYMKRARRCFKESKDAFEDKDYPVTIRRAQECVEMSLKAVLRGTSVEYPKEHDVSDTLEIVMEKFPDWFSSRIPEFMRISKDLSKKRGPALYGYEARLTPASDIFSKNDADEALMSAEKIFDACTRLINEMFENFTSF